MSRSSLLTAAACVAVAWKLLIFPGQTLVDNDAGGDILPYNRTIAMDWEGLAPPQYNPHLNAGTPNVGNLSTGFYPPFLMALLPDSLAINAFVFVHLLLGAFGMRSWARASGLDEKGATVAAICYAMAAVWPARILAGHLSMIAVLGWAPVVLGRLERLVRAPSAGGAAALAAAGAMMLLGGHAQWIYIVGWLGLFVALTAANRAWPKALAGIVAAALGATLLAAVQILPALDLLGHTARMHGVAAWEQLPIWVDPADLLALVVPYLPGHDDFRWETAWGLGTAGLLLWIAGLWHARREPRTWVFLGLSVTALIVAMGPATPLHAAARSLIPLYDQMRALPRLLLLFALTAPLLAARGFGALSDGRGRWAGIGVTAALVAGAFAGDEGVLALFFFGAAAAAAFWRRPAVVVGILAVEMTLNAALWIWVAPPKQAWRFDLPRDGRVYDTVSWPFNDPLLSGHEAIHGTTAQVLEDYLRFYNAIWNDGKPLLPGTFPYPVSEIRRRSLFDLLGVKYVITKEALEGQGFTRLQEHGDRIFVYRNEQAMAGAFLVSRGALGPAFDFSEIPSPEQQGDVTVMSRRPGRLELKCIVAKPSLLALNEIRWPGWKATVDGAPAEILPAWLALMAVELEPGEHRVELRYDLESYRRGAWISSLAWIAMAAWAAWRFRRPASA